MPDNSYTQYNTNVQAVATAHVVQYMGWYEAAILLYVLATVAFVIYWFFQSRAVVGLGIFFSIAGLLSQLLSLGLRAYYSHHVPWNDLYGSLSVVALWAVFLFLIFSWRFKLWFVGPLVLGLSDVLLAYARGWNKGLSPMPASLQDNYWIFIHVPVVLAAYAAFLIGCATSILFLLKKWDEERVARIAGKSVGAAVAAQQESLGRPAWLSWLDIVPASTRLDVVSYRIIAVGEILLTAGIILGALWAHQAWGSYWQWDPKENAALASWIVYAAYLHLHTRPSWRGVRTAWVSIVGFLSILFCYFGVNIWISGMHSYK
jgi:cytochrome c-type biogenesis protein CcsB